MTTVNIKNLPNDQEIGWTSGRRAQQEDLFLPLMKFRRALHRLNVDSGSPRNMKVMMLGDSLVGRPGWPFFNTLKQRTLFDANLNRSMKGGLANLGEMSYVVAGGAVANTDSNYTVDRESYTLGVEGANVIVATSSPDGPYATSLKVFYVAENGAGTFSIETSTDTKTAPGFDEQVASVDADNSGAAALGVHTLSGLTYDQYLCRLTRVTGSVTILAVAFINDSTTEAPNIDLHGFVKGGLDSSGVENMTDAFGIGYFDAIDPDVVFLCWDDPASSLNIFAPKLNAWITGSTSPPPLVVWIGSGPKDGAEQSIIDQNRKLEEYCRLYGWVHVDGTKALGESWDDLDDLGEGGDGTHLSGDAYAYLAMQAYKQIGLLSDMDLAASNLRNWNNADDEELHPQIRRLAISKGARNTPAATLFTDAAIGLDTFLELGRNLFIRDDNGSTNRFGIFSNLIRLYNHVLSLGATEATPTIRYGTGSPESVVTAGIGSLFLRHDGGASTSLYVKESGTGNTGWVAK